MARKNKEERLADVHLEAMARWRKSADPLWEERQQCLMDRRFCNISGAQWEGRLQQQFENRPRLEMNKIRLSVMRIINEKRQNPISVKFRSPDGKDRDAFADTVASIYRADEYDSNAEEARDVAYEEAVTGGFGAWCLYAHREEPDEDEEEEYGERPQRICWEPIPDADTSVYFDVNSKRMDKSDARYAFKLVPMSPEAFEREWPKAPALSSWPQATYSTGVFDWVKPDLVYVAEYYVVEETKEPVQVWGLGIDGPEERHVASEVDDVFRAELLAQGMRLKRTIKRERKRVHKYIMSGCGVLEDCGYIPGRHIPIIPVYGMRFFVGGVERVSGHVRMAKDPQRLKNMQVSKLAEVASLSSVSKPVMSPEEIAGFEHMYETDNIKNWAYLLKNRVMDKDGNEVRLPMEYTQPTQVPPALAALVQFTESDLQDILGNQGEADKMVGNMSGVATEMIQTRADSLFFVYHDNFRKAVAREGVIYRDMARDLYVEENRRMKTMSTGGEMDSTVVNVPSLDDEGAHTMDNDLTRATFDVVTDVGPATASRRQSTVRSLTAMLPMVQDPQTQQVVVAMIMTNMDGEGLTDVKPYFRRKLLEVGAVQPTEQEQQEMAQAQQAAQNAPPDPQQQLLAAATAETQAKAEKAQADTQKSLAEVGRIKADTVKTLSEIGKPQQPLRPFPR
jgi:hypothetical protein